MVGFQSTNVALWYIHFRYIFTNYLYVQVEQKKRMLIQKEMEVSYLLENIFDLERTLIIWYGNNFRTS